MFRRQEKTLDPDAKYLADLKELGYFIDKNCCIRQIEAPDHFFDFFYTNNDRHNEVRGEAMRVCQREEVLKRLSALGLKELYLPTLSNTKPDGPHIPILAPAADVLKTRKRVIVLINDDCYQDLGILAYRELQREGGLNGGSVINFVKELSTRTRAAGDMDVIEELAKDGARIDKDEDIPGLVVLNAGQLLYSHKFNKALSIRSWNALPRKSITHDAVVIHPIENRVPGHATPQEHIKSAFDSVIMNPDLVSPEAEIYVVAIENGAEKLIDVLSHEFRRYAPRLKALAIMHLSMDSCQIHDPELKAFLHTRARQWKSAQFKSTSPGQCISLPSEYDSKAVSHKPDYEESIDWLEIVAGGDGGCADAPSTDVHAETKATPEQVKQDGTSTEDFQDEDPICPTFGGGDTWVGECVFTQRPIQQAVLSFFEDVARDPNGFCNPDFSLDVAEPSPDNPLTFAPADSDETLPEEMLNPDKKAVMTAQAELDNMKTAFLASPQDYPAIVPGLRLLQQRIVKKEAELAELEKKALKTGGLGAGASQELRDKWEPKTSGEKWVEKKSGPAITFAGVEADSEVVKSAGCLNTVEEELAKLELEED